MNKQKKIILALVAVAVVLVAVLTVNNYRSIETEEQSLDEVEVTDSAEVEEITYKYGIPVDRYNVKYGIVKPNQNLSFILSDHGLSSQNIHDLNLKTEGVFDVRKIRSGRAYAMFTSKDSLATPKFFVYEEDPKSYVVFDLRGEYKVTRGQNPVEWRTKEAKGKINSSLWVAMQDCNTSPQLAIVLSHIFGWTIDFFGLQKEDEFRVIYEQEYVDGNALQNFHVLAASFRASDSTYYAIPFTQDGEELYYNEKGNSLEGAFLKAPLDFYRISSRFTNSRYHPVLKRYRAHHGVDYAAPTGTPVYAIGNGKVIAKGYQAGGGGNYVKIKHNSVYVTRLCRFHRTFYRTAS